jgi:hypothetical protein
MLLSLRIVGSAQTIQPDHSNMELTAKKKAVTSWI